MSDGAPLPARQEQPLDIAFAISAAIRRDGNHVDVIRHELRVLLSEIGALRTAVASYRSLANAASIRADGYHEALHTTGLCPDLSCQGYESDK